MAYWNAALFISSLRRPIRSAPGTAWLIVDNLRAHYAVTVGFEVQANRDQIEVHGLPSCAPAHNPDGHPSKDVTH